MSTSKYRRGQRRDDLRMAFAAWLVTPNRDPRTQAEWAQAHGTSESTLSEWRRHPAVLAALESWRDSYRAHFAEVVEAMYRKARAGDVAAARLVGEWLGEAAPTRIEQTLLSNSPWGQLLSEIRDRRKGLEVIEGGKAEAGRRTEKAAGAGQSQTDA